MSCIPNIAFVYTFDYFLYGTIMERNVSSCGKLKLPLSLNKGKEDNKSKGEEKGKALPPVSKVTYVRQRIKQYFENKVPMLC